MVSGGFSWFSLNADVSILFYGSPFCHDVFIETLLQLQHVSCFYCCHVHRVQMERCDMFNGSILLPVCDLETSWSLINKQLQGVQGHQVQAHHGKFTCSLNMSNVEVLKCVRCSPTQSACKLMPLVEKTAALKIPQQHILFFHSVLLAGKVFLVKH